jgi:endo-alpha-1,4-polygalactosaminidase (GH114 family)
MTALTVTALVALALIAIGAVALAAPRFSSQQYGIVPGDPRALAFLRAMGVRDLVIGVLLLLLAAAGRRELLAWGMAASAAIAALDLAVVRAAGGPMAARALHAGGGIALVIAALVIALAGPASGQAVWQPAPGTTWQWQITGVVDESIDVAMYDIDLFDAAPAGLEIGAGSGVFTEQGQNAGVIERLHARGIVVICYLSTGTAEEFRPDVGLFPEEALGNPVDGFPDERWLDMREASWPLWAPLMWARFDLAAAIGCDGVEPDNNNPVGNDTGFPATLADQKAWYLEVAAQAHARGLSVGQKNGIETTDASVVAAFDWNLNEQCFQYDECDALDPVIDAGKAVFSTEYKGNPKKFCPELNARGFSTLRKKTKLDAWARACWMPPKYPARGRRN